MPETAAMIDESPHLDLVRDGGELWENHGWCIRASAGNHEFLMWVAFYILRGEPRGRFTVGDVRIAQSIVVHGIVDDEGRTHMNDLPFTVVGVNASEHRPASALAVSVDDDAVRWRMDGRTHESAPPRWRISGACGELDVELELEALAPVSRFDGFDLIHGYEALALVAGTITTPEGALRVSGLGQHEKVHTGVPIQRGDGAGWLTLPPDQRHMWHCGGDASLAFSMLANQPGEQADRLNGQFVVDGVQRHFGRADVRFEERSTWLDPRSGVTVPTEWRIEVAHPDGRLTLDVGAFARAYYLWDYMRGSTSLLYWFMADADACWTPASGAPVTRRRLPYAAHTNRPFLYWGLSR